jgi:electron transport complex protein RnfC
MRSIRTFKQGGILVGAAVDWESSGPVKNAFLPNSAVILLKQHAGKQARCVVKRGEYVREGMVVGRANGALSANVHSSVPGIVRDIRLVPLPEGGQAEAVVVALEGSFERIGRKDERYLWKSMGRAELLATLRDRGVVDTVAPGMPLFDILGERRDIGLLIVNAVECEPYLRAESSLLRDKGPEVMEGIAIAQTILSPKRTVLASSGADTSSLVQSPDTGPAIQFADLEPRSPQDLPGQLLEAVEGSRGQVEGGVVILKPTALFAAYEAIVLAKPMMERFVSISGGALKRPAVLKARIGTPIGDLIEECGGFLGPPSRLVMSGALRCYSVYDLDTPVTKTTSAVIALCAKEVGPRLRSPCIRCGRCSEVCPERLDPELLYRLVERGLSSKALDLGLASCTGCGSCGYICPSRVPLVAAFSAKLSSSPVRRSPGESSTQASICEDGGA